MNISSKLAPFKSCMLSVYGYWWRITICMQGLVAMTERLKLTSRLGLLLVFFATTSFNSDHPANRLLGVWQFEEKNLRIEMFEEDGHFSGKMIWFLCPSESIMNAYRDTKNPQSELTTRPLVGLKLVEKLSYQGDDTWGSGKIYDPNSGYTWDAQIQLTGPNTVVVRGYWKFKWFGKSMVFNRLM